MQNWIFDIRSRTFVLLIISFLIITFLVYFDVTTEFDQSSVHAFQSIAGNPTFDFLMQSVTEIGDVYYMLVFGIILLIIKRTRRIGITIMVLLVMTTILTGYIKCGVDRDRPDLEFLGNPFLIELSADTFSLFCEGGFNASYPSGHAARAAVFGVILGFALSERFPRGCYLLLLYPLLMAISRVYVLQHFPMDVIGGTILGIFLAGAIGQKSKLYKLFEKSKS